MTDYWRSPYPVRPGRTDPKGFIIPSKPVLTPEELGSLIRKAPPAPAPETPKEAPVTAPAPVSDPYTIVHEVTSLVPAPHGHRWAVCPIEDGIVEAKTTRRFKCLPYQMFKGEILYLEGASGLYLIDARVGNISVPISDYEHTPIAVFQPAKQLDFPTANIGSIILFDVLNDTLDALYFAGAILGFASSF